MFVAKTGRDVVLLALVVEWIIKIVFLLVCPRIYIPGSWQQHNKKSILSQQKNEMMDCVGENKQLNNFVFSTPKHVSKHQKFI